MTDHTTEDACTCPLIVGDDPACATHGAPRLVAVTYTAEQQKANRDKWIAALRSGDFLQTRMVLRDTNDDGEAMYCCLGVACELASREGIIGPARDLSNNPTYGECGQGGEGEELPDPVVDWLGLATRTGDLTSEVDGEDSLIELNDSAKYDFPAIAEIVASGKVKLAGAS